MTRTRALLWSLMLSATLQGPSAAELSGQGCGWDARFGASITLGDLPPRDVAGRELGAGPGVGLGLTCARGPGTVHGATILAQGFDWVTAGYVLGRFGWRINLSQGERSPWLDFTAVAGIVGAAELGSQALFQVFGMNTKLPSVGFALGAGPRLGISSGPGVIFVDVFVLATFLDSEFRGPGGEVRDEGFAGFGSVPIAIGYQFSP